MSPSLAPLGETLEPLTLEPLKGEKMAKIVWIINGSNHVENR